MNKEPKVTLPEPPEGHVWEYVGKGVAFDGTCAYFKEDRERTYKGDRSYGFSDIHYWRAVEPRGFGLTTEQKLSVAVKALKKARGWAVADAALKQIL